MTEPAVNQIEQTEQRPTVEELERERDVYRAALQQIAGAESGGWGWIAYRALREGQRARA